MEEVPNYSGDDSKVRLVHGIRELGADKSVRFPGPGLAVSDHGEVVSVEDQFHELLHRRLVHSLLRG